MPQTDATELAGPLAVLDPLLDPSLESPKNGHREGRSTSLFRLDNGLKFIDEKVI